MAERFTAEDRVYMDPQVLPRPRRSPSAAHRVLWAMMLICALFMLGAAFLPAADLTKTGSRGGGETQQVVDATTRVAFVPDAMPAVLPYLLAAGVVAALAAAALFGFERWWACAIVFGIAVWGVAAVTVLVGAHLPWVVPPESGPNSADGLFTDSVRLLSERLRSGGYEVVVGNAVRMKSLAGLRIIQPALLLIAIAAAYRLLRFRLARWPALASLVGGGAVVYLLLLLAAIPPT